MIEEYRELNHWKHYLIVINFMYSHTKKYIHKKREKKRTGRGVDKERLTARLQPWNCFFVLFFSQALFRRARGSEKKKVGSNISFLISFRTCVLTQSLLLSLGLGRVSIILAKFQKLPVKFLLPKLTWRLPLVLLLPFV